MVFVSGFSSLVYQILWMRQIGLLFGNTSQAAAITLGAFFSGLTAGSWFWGKRSSKSKKPLLVYGYLELGIAMTALLYFAVHHSFYSVYPQIHQWTDSLAAMILYKILMSLFLVFPPAFCMGGTVPVIGQFLVLNRNAFGKISAMLFALNTIGAAAGAFFSAFYLVPLLGFQGTCIGAILLSTMVAIFSLYLSRGIKVNQPSAEVVEKITEFDGSNSALSIAKIKNEKLCLRLICFVSGFSVLALEVIWTRMFAQVHENSVYSLSIVLVVVLLALGLGSMVSSLLARHSKKPLEVLSYLMCLSGISVMLCPYVFLYITNDFTMMSTAGTFVDFMSTLFKHGFISIGLVALVLGMVFPFLMKIEESFLKEAGQSLGRLSAINTLGAIAGSLVCGFVLLENFGMWRSLQFISAGYLLISLMMNLTLVKGVLLNQLLAMVGLILLFTILNPVNLSMMGGDPARGKETVIKTWQSSDSTVVVTDTHGGHHRKILINSNYSLGSTSGLIEQVFQSRIPLIVFPKTESVFYLGMGTGSTAGAALNEMFALKRLLVCELSPKVVVAARDYMTDFQNRDFTFGLFKDPRVEILVEDGRQHLLVIKEKFDMINADLFLPYRSGAGSLYSLEHFKTAKNKLKPGGVFVQWLPLYQLTKNEFGIIAKTMLKAFPRVTMWRNNFQPRAEIVALVGHQDKTPLAKTLLNSSAEKRECVVGKSFYDISNLRIIMNEQTILIYYCGNLSKAEILFKDFPINTDDRPLIEYMSPKSLRIWKDGVPPPFTNEKLAKLIDKVFKISPLRNDPFLKNRSDEDCRLPLAGVAFHKAHINALLGDTKQVREQWTEFLFNWTNR